MSTIDPEQQRDPLERGVEAGEAKSKELSEARAEVHGLLDQFRELGLATDAMIQKYRTAADADQPLEGLVGFKAWIEDRLDAGRGQLQGVESDLKKALDEKAVSKKDLASMREKVLFSDSKDFIGSTDEVKKEIQKQLAIHREGRKAFDRIAAHPAVEKGVLVDQEGNEVAIPKLEEYLEWSIDRRKEFITKADRALDALGSEKGETAPLRSVRLALNKAKSEKIFGQIIDEKWMEEFKTLKPDEQKKCLVDLGRRIADHRKFWGEARKTLGPADIRSLESKADEKSLTELKKEFENRVDRESARLESDYESILSEKVHERILPISELNKCIEGIRRANLPEKRRMVERLSINLQPAHELRQRIDKLSDPEARQRLIALYRDPKTTLETIRLAVDRQAVEESKVRKPSSSADRILSKIDAKRQRVKDSMAEASQKLDETKKRSLVSRLGHFLFGKRESDYGSLSDQVRHARREQGKAESRDLGVRGPEFKKGADGHLEQMSYAKADGGRGRVVKLDIKDARAIEKFTDQDALNSKDDKLSLVTGIKEKDRELNFKETRIFVEYLKEDLKNPKKGRARLDSNPKHEVSK